MNILHIFAYDISRGSDDMEQWKQIEYKGITYDYEVSTKGRVRNLKTGRIVKGVKTRGNYLQVGLHKNGQKTRVYIQVLVMNAFNPTDNDTLEINHINENTQNNRLENLEWLSHGNNIRHGTRTERSTKKRSKRVKCVDTGEEFDSVNDCSRKTGIPSGSISRNCRGISESCRGLHFEFIK